MAGFLVRASRIEENWRFSSWPVYPKFPLLRMYRCSFCIIGAWFKIRGYSPAEVQREADMPEEPKGGLASEKAGSIDWIDSVLGMVGFMSWLVFVVVALKLELVNPLFLDQSLDIGTLVCIFTFIYLWRKIFGRPKLPPPRMGAYWSLVTVIGMLERGLFHRLGGLFPSGGGGAAQFLRRSGGAAERVSRTGHP
jgi:hypothetical protein